MSKGKAETNAGLWPKQHELWVPGHNWEFAVGLSAKQFSITFRGKLEALGHKQSYWKVSLELRDGRSKKVCAVEVRENISPRRPGCSPSAASGLAVWSKQGSLQQTLVLCRQLSLYREQCSCSRAYIPFCFKHLSRGAKLSRATCKSCLLRLKH